MGVDITMKIVNSNGDVIVDNVFRGRNSAWFDNISDYCARDIEYKYFPRETNYDDVLMKNMPNEDDGFYGFSAVNAEKYFNWYTNYKPYLHAGWVTKYDAWAYAKKGIEIGMYDDVSQDYPGEGYEFIEYIYHTPDTDVIEALVDFSGKHDYELNNLWVVYCFDR